jgi:hypothetical protein
MAAIDVGPGATDRGASTTLGTNTYIDTENPANASGIIDVLEIFMDTNGAGVKIGVATGSGTTWAINDYETIGNVSSGSKQTFTGKEVTVTAGDCMAVWGSSGELETGTTGSSLYKAGDQCGTGSQSGYTTTSRTLSLYATGAEGPSHLKTINSLAKVDIKTINGLAISSVKSLTSL